MQIAGIWCLSAWRFGLTFDGTSLALRARPIHSLASRARIIHSLAFRARIIHSLAFRARIIHSLAFWAVIAAPRWHFGLIWAEAGSNRVPPDALFSESATVGHRRVPESRENRMIQREHSLIHHIQTIFDAGTVAELTDGQLLERFVQGVDRETAELCFAALIKRHGPMVLRTCQVILHDGHDAEDAFQATFLVLARKARSLWTQNSLGPWLYQVACRVAAHARSAASRHRVHERKAAGMRRVAAEDRSRDDRGAVLYEELQRLPDRYRTAVVLCDLEGLTHERAAEVLGWPSGTVRSRVARGRAAAARPINAPRIGTVGGAELFRGLPRYAECGCPSSTCGDHDGCRRATGYHRSNDQHYGLGRFVDGRSTESHVLE